MEVWKTIEGFENYQISDHGRVRSIDRYVSRPDGSKQFVRGAYIAPSAKIRVRNDQGWSIFYTDELVAKHFLGLGPKEFYHIDGNGNNCEVSNLGKIEIDSDEIWVPVPVEAYAQYYQVSSKGRVRSLDRYIEMINNGTRCNRLIRSKILKAHYENDNNYDRVAFTIDGVTKFYSVHRLVAMAFIPNPKNKPYVNHKDGTYYNNCVENLEWCTEQENSTHWYSTYSDGNRVENHTWVNDGTTSKLIHVRDVEAYLAEGWAYGDLDHTYHRTQESIDRQKQAAVGRICIHREDRMELKYVHHDVLDSYLSDGWFIGGYEAFNLDCAQMYKDDETRYVPMSEVSYYKSLGWKRGSGKVYITDGKSNRLVIPEEAKKLVESGDWSYGKCYGSTQDTICLNNGKINKFVHKSEVNYYLASGWKIGSVRIFINNGTESKSVSREDAEKLVASGEWEYGKHKGTTGGTVGMNNGKINKFVPKDEVSQFEAEGWKFGLIKREGKPPRGKFMTNEIETRVVKPKDEAEYLSKGWRFGRCKSKALRRHKAILGSSFTEI